MDQRRSRGRDGGEGEQDLDHVMVVGLDCGAVAGQGRQRFQRWLPWPSQGRQT